MSRVGYDCSFLLLLFYLPFMSAKLGTAESVIVCCVVLIFLLGRFPMLNLNECTSRCNTSFLTRGQPFNAFMFLRLLYVQR